MLVKSKLVTQGKQPFHAGPHVHVLLNSTSYYSNRLARYLLHPSTVTSTLSGSISRSVIWVRNESIKRSFYTDSHDRQAQVSPKDLPLYREYSPHF